MNRKAFIYRSLRKCLVSLFLLLALTGIRTTVLARSETDASEKTVTVKLNSRKGKLKEKTISVRKNGTFGKLPVPEREGYQFTGWYTEKKNGTRVRAKTKYRDVKVKTLYAHWEIVTYTITYKADGGTLPQGKSNPDTYTVKDKIRLAKPEKEGYVFSGWYTKKKAKNAKKIKVIAKGTTGNLKLYARYEPVTYTIQFKKNGVIKTGFRKMTVKYGEYVTLPSSSETAFASWNTSADGSGKQYLGGVNVKNLTAKKGETVTLYANPFIVGNNISKLFEYFVRIGFTKAASAGIVGNLMYESGGGYSDVKLNAVEWSTGRGIGMCQWTDTADMSRRTNFERYCASQGKPWPNQDLKVQVDFLMDELEGVKYGKVWYFLPSQGYPASYEMTLAKFKKIKDVSTAVAVFCANFERPRPEHANLSVRTSYARYVLNTYGS